MWGTPPLPAFIHVSLLSSHNWSGSLLTNTQKTSVICDTQKGIRNCCHRWWIGYGVSLYKEIPAQSQAGRAKVWRNLIWISAGILPSVPSTQFLHNYKHSFAFVSCTTEHNSFIIHTLQYWWNAVFFTVVVRKMWRIMSYSCGKNFPAANCLRSQQMMTAFPQTHV